MTPPKMSQRVDYCFIVILQLCQVDESDWNCLCYQGSKRKNIYMKKNTKRQNQIILATIVCSLLMAKYCAFNNNLNIFHRV